MRSATPPARSSARRMRRRAPAVLSIDVAVVAGFGVLPGLHVLR